MNTPESLGLERGAWLKAGWRRMDDDELRSMIDDTSGTLRRLELRQGARWEYWRRLYRARLIVLRNELDRRISRGG